jgi:hypothetical protein
MVGLLGYKIEYGGKAGASTSINLGYIGEQSFFHLCLWRRFKR